MSFQLSTKTGYGTRETANWIYASRSPSILSSDGFRSWGRGYSEWTFWDSLVRDFHARMLIQHDSYEYAHVARTNRDLFFPQGRYFEPLGFVCNKRALHFGIYGKEKLQGNKEKISTFLFIRNGKKNPFKFAVRDVSKSKMVDFGAAKLFNPGFEAAYAERKYLWVNLDALPLFARAKRGEPRSHLPGMLTTHAKKLKKLRAIEEAHQTLTSSPIPHVVHGNGFYKPGYHTEVVGYKTIIEPVTFVTYGLQGEVTSSEFTMPASSGHLQSLYAKTLQEAANLQLRIRAYTLIAETFGDESIVWGDVSYQRSSVTHREAQLTVCKDRFTLQRVSCVRMIPRSVKEKS